MVEDAIRDGDKGIYLPSQRHTGHGAYPPHCLHMHHSMYEIRLTMKQAMIFYGKRAMPHRRSCQRQKFNSQASWIGIEGHRRPSVQSEEAMYDMTHNQHKNLDSSVACKGSRRRLVDPRDLEG